MVADGDEEERADVDIRNINIPLDVDEGAAQIPAMAEVDGLLSGPGGGDRWSAGGFMAPLLVHS